MWNDNCWVIICNYSSAKSWQKLFKRVCNKINYRIWVCYSKVGCRGNVQIRKFLYCFRSDPNHPKVIGNLVILKRSLHRLWSLGHILSLNIDSGSITKEWCFKVIKIVSKDNVADSLTNQLSLLLRERLVESFEIRFIPVWA